MSKPLFWDFDGTLATPNKSFFTALNTWLCESGYCVQLNETVDFLEKAYSWKSPQIDYVKNCGELWWDSLFKKINAFCAEKISGVQTGIGFVHGLKSCL